MSDIAVWAGVVGAAVGGGFGYAGALIQARTTRSEGNADRRHQIEVIAEEKRNDAYVKVARLVQKVVDYRIWVLSGRSYIGPPHPIDDFGEVGVLVDVYGSVETRRLWNRLVGEWNVFARESNREPLDVVQVNATADTLATTETELIERVRAEVQTKR